MKVQIHEMITLSTYEVHEDEIKEPKLHSETGLYFQLKELAKKYFMSCEIVKVSPVCWDVNMKGPVVPPNNPSLGFILLELDQ